MIQLLGFPVVALAFIRQFAHHHSILRSLPMGSQLRNTDRPLSNTAYSRAVISSWPVSPLASAFILVPWVR
ncbi:hypothetical protein OG21DRAFT_1512768 [Imleria badia]|nr:hypothetical protein OG21DRAFT_1512768 [Imleria badia]